MADFRYAQFCPLARATEIVGERWTLLVVRELLLGPKRFSDLKRALAGVSPSILSERLARLEERGVIEQRQSPPPTPATLYELGDIGRELIPALLELARWGARFLHPSQPGDHFESEWLRVGFLAFARKTPTPAHAYAICVEGSDPVEFSVTGGENGTAVSAGRSAADVTLYAASPLVVFALANGTLAPDDAIASGAIRVEGDAAALHVLPELFNMASDASSPQTTGE